MGCRSSCCRWLARSMYLTRQGMLCYTEAMRCRCWLSFKLLQSKQLADGVQVCTKAAAAV
jgi:hypothetical protein